MYCFFTGGVYEPCVVSAGESGPGGSFEWGGCEGPVGQPVMGATVCHEWWRGALQHSGPSCDAEEPDRSSSWPTSGIPYLLISAHPLTLLMITTCPTFHLCQHTHWCHLNMNFIKSAHSELFYWTYEAFEIATVVVTFGFWKKCMNWWTSAEWSKWDLFDDQQNPLHT